MDEMQGEDGDDERPSSVLNTKTAIEDNDDDKKKLERARSNHQSYFSEDFVRREWSVEAKSRKVA